MTPMIELILQQLESSSEDEDRSPEECKLLKIWEKELRNEFNALEARTKEKALKEVYDEFMKPYVTGQETFINRLCAMIKP